MLPFRVRLSRYLKPGLIVAAALAAAVLAEPALAQVDPTAVFTTKFGQAAQNLRVISFAIFGVVVIAIGVLIFTGQEVSRWVWAALYGICIASGGAAITSWLAA